MKLGVLISLIKQDYERITHLHQNGKLAGVILFIPRIFLDASFCVTFWFRISSFLYEGGIFGKLISAPFIFIYKFFQRSTGIQMPICTSVGGGLTFKHYSGIVIARSCVIGKNCTLHQNVTLGRGYSIGKAGCPIIGNNVVVFPSSTVIGKISIGDNVIVGANSVVISDVPSGTIVAGCPAKIVSNDSSLVIKSLINVKL